MYGAILGDIIGSPYEFDQNNIKTTEFELFSERSEFTDDSIMTLAVAEGLMNCGVDADEETMKKALVAAMKKYGNRYPFAGYGANFSMWLSEEDPKPYKSFGNGSAMLLREDIEGTEYVTYVYCYDGYLCELFTEYQEAAEPENGATEGSEASSPVRSLITPLLASLYACTPGWWNALIWMSSA